MVEPLSPSEREEAVFLLGRAKKEDGFDITSRALLPETARIAAPLVTREACCVAGLPVARLVCEDFGVSFTPLVKDGAMCAAGHALARLAGDARAVLGCERILLNFLGRLSGIATLTKRYVEAFHPTAVYDTRKTTPGWRRLEKYAVRAGGGRNHRLGLEDQILIKDNHLAVLRFLGITAGVRSSIERARQYRTERLGREGAGADLRIEIEVENEEDFREAAASGADIIMLDNWSIEAIRRALSWLRSEGPAGVEIELSGGIKLDRAAELAPLGADRVSVGALTRSPRGIDISLDLP